MIRAQDVSKYYGTKRALGPVSFEIEDGETIGFLGLNGAGKTTTDLGPILLGDLKGLRSRLASALGKTSDQMTRLHLEASMRKIDEILMPRPPVIVTTAPAGGGGFRGPGG